MLLAIVVFFAVFLVAGLLIAASGSARAEAAKQTLSRLTGAVASTASVVYEEPVDVRKREKLSGIPLLNRLMAQVEGGGWLRQLLSQAESNWTPATVLLMIIAFWLATAALLTLKTALLPLAFLLGVIPAALPILFLLKKRTRRFRKFQEGLPPALDLMVSGMRAGHSIVSALDLVARDSPDPIGKEFRLCFDEQNYGLELRDALRNLANRVPLPDLRIVITAILVQKETGGNLAEVLDKCAVLIRERFRLQKEIQTRTAQGRLTGWILSALPPGLGFLLFLAHPEVISLLWTRPAGVRLLWIGSCMTIFGSLVIRKIVAIKV